MNRYGHTCHDQRIDGVRQFKLKSCQRIRRAGSDKQQKYQGDAKNDHTVLEVSAESAF